MSTTWRLSVKIVKRFERNRPKGLYEVCAFSMLQTILLTRTYKEWYDLDPQDKEVILNDLVGVAEEYII